MYLILLGAPGSGKGTQAAMLAKTLTLPHVASGDLFRDHSARGTALGRLAQSYMERGALVPDEVTIQMILERLAEPDCADGCILDGFPRTLEQARALDAALAQQKKTVYRALYLQVSTEELLRRLGGRWICQDCQTPYHEVSAPPRTPGICDRCGGPLYQRADDNRETARQRLEVYFQQTAPLINYYQSQGKLAEVLGEGDVESVGQALLASTGQGAREERAVAAHRPYTGEGPHAILENK